MPGPVGAQTRGDDRTTVLLTGASSGLGLAIARLLLRDPRYRLILTARAASLPRLSAHGIFEGERVRLRALDVTVADQRRAVVQEAAAEWGGVDVLINNAGIAFRSVVEHVNEQERLLQMEVNFLGPMHLMRLCLPGMRARRRGRIVNVSSVAGMMAMPTMAIYSASKWALEGASEALWYEVRPWGIHVTLVEPGFIRSDSFRNTRYSREGERSAHAEQDGYHEHYERMAPFVERLMQRASATPETVARRIVALLRRRHPPLRMPATRDAWAFYLLRRLLPRSLYHWVLWRSLPGARWWGGGSGP